jgi:hypothetical protein
MKLYVHTRTPAQKQRQLKRPSRDRWVKRRYVVVLVRLSSLWQNYCHKQLKRRICFGSWFQGFQSAILASSDSGPVVRQNIMVAGAGGRGTSPDSTWFAHRERKDQGPGVTLKDTPPMASFLQLEMGASKQGDP